MADSSVTGTDIWIVHAYNGEIEGVFTDHAKALRFAAAHGLEEDVWRADPSGAWEEPNVVLWEVVMDAAGTVDERATDIVEGMILRGARAPICCHLEACGGVDCDDRCYTISGWVYALTRARAIEAAHVWRREAIEHGRWDGLEPGHCRSAIRR